MWSKLVFITLLVFTTNVYALYSRQDDVVELTDANFDSKVKNSDGVWIVEFYSPNCGHCVNFAPEYKKAATALKGVVNVGGVDATRNSQLAGKFNIRGYPTVKIFGADKSSPDEFQGQRTSESLIDEGFKAARKLVNKRTGKGSSSGSGSGGSDVVELTEANFEKMVMKSEKIWFIGFFAPWCGHCQRLKPDFESAASQMKGKIMFGSVDATVHQNLASKYQVQGYPTLKMFGADKTNPIAYEGGRTAADIVQFCTEKHMTQLPPPKAEQLVKPGQLDVCKEKQLCIIAALPDLLDCQSKCRKAYIKSIESAGDKHKAKDWRYFWVGAMEQPLVESTFNLGGFGYPALIAVNEKKQKYATMKGSFSTDGIHEFLRDVSLGSKSVRLQEVKEMPQVKKIDPWDGKDGKMLEVDEISLDDLKDEL